MSLQKCLIDLNHGNMTRIIASKYLIIAVNVDAIIINLYYDLILEDSRQITS